MNKEAAAKFLGMSVRSLQRLTSEGLFKPTLAGAKGAAVYDAAELQQWRDMSEDERREARDVARKPAPGALSPMTVMTEKSDVTGNGVMTVTHDTLNSRREFAQMIAEAVATKPVFSLADKLTLSFKEAALLSGVPESHLREGYARGMLRGAKIGRGVRVTPDDVRKYVEARMKGKR